MTASWPQGEQLTSPRGNGRLVGSSSLWADEWRTSSLEWLGLRVAMRCVLGCSRRARLGSAAAAGADVLSRAGAIGTGMEQNAHSLKTAV